MYKQQNITNNQLLYIAEKAIEWLILNFEYPDELGINHIDNVYCFIEFNNGMYEEGTYTHSYFLTTYSKYFITVNRLHFNAPQKKHKYKLYQVKDGNFFYLEDLQKEILEEPLIPTSYVKDGIVCNDHLPMKRYICRTCGNTGLVYPHKMDNSICGGCDNPQWELNPIQESYLSSDYERHRSEVEGKRKENPLVPL